MKKFLLAFFVVLMFSLSLVLAAEVAVTTSVDISTGEQTTANELETTTTVETDVDTDTSETEEETSPETCYNSEQDGDEEGIDCGGSCNWICAEDEQEIEITDEEVESFSYGLGAEIRMQQLLYRVLHHTYAMNEVLNYVEDEAAAQNAKVALEYMSDLAVEIEAYDVTAVQKEVAVEQYVSFKAQAIEYTRKFRASVQGEIDDEERRLIQEAMNAIKENDLADLRSEIRLNVRAHNQARASTALEKLGVQDAELLVQIESGEITLGQIRSRMVGKYTELSEERQIEARARLAEKRVEARELATKARIEIRSEVQKELAETRANNRMDEIELRRRIAADTYNRADAVAQVHQVNDRFRVQARQRTTINGGLHADAVVHRDVAARNIR
jgi:hypothetical protein